MKKIIMLGLIVAVSMMFIGCGKKEEKKKEATPQVQEQAPDETASEGEASGEDAAGEADTEKVDGESTLCTDDKSVSVKVIRPEGFEDSDYSSEHQVAFQRLGADGTSSTQLNLRLMTEDENAVMAGAQQEVEYLLSANSDGGTVGEVQSQTVGEKQYSYFTYSLEGTEGYRMWTSLDNGCVLSVIAENIGSGLEPLTAEYLIQILEAAIV